MKTNKAGVKVAKIQGDILYEPYLSAEEKLLVGLAATFKKGLTLGNDELGRIIGAHPTNVSKLLSKLQSDGWVRIENQQSRWRKIYFGDITKVKRNDTLVKNKDTLVTLPTYFGDVTKQNLKNINNKGKNSFLPNTSDAEFITPSAKKTPDPETARRVLEDLQFLPESEAANG